MQAAQRAAQASADANGNANAAAAAARQAADAATKAAAAAQAAVGAANAASTAARVAAGAASRAATAASMAGRAAANAYSAAAAASTDASKGPAAVQAAKDAYKAATGASQAAEAAAAAGVASSQASDVAKAASLAGDYAAAAAAAAAHASTDASNAGADSRTAQAAAATAQADANRAHRAASAAQNFANVAANAAFASRDAANRAATDAQTAADAATDAAAHAGNAANAAAQATAHANAATAAAQAAVTAATQAQQVYDAARTADAVRLSTTTDQNNEAASAAKTANAQTQSSLSWDTTQAAKRTAETNRLITEAAAAGTDPATALVDARTVAITLAKTGGPWTSAAAEAALAGPDALAMEFVKTGIDTAAGQDDRLILGDLADTGTSAMHDAATTALGGTDADVETFLQTRQYPGYATDDRIAVDQVLAAAQQSGSVSVQQDAQTALNANTDQALRTFLTKTQYTSAGHDDRIAVDQILANPASGPELTAAAQTALDGPSDFAHQFLVSGQYAAAQRDQDAATHDAVVTGYLAQAAQAAATATQNANEAQATAATARGAANDAAGYAQQARDSATQAATYAQQAHASATQAANSAAQAAASAVTAQNAASSAQQSATHAAQSANWAYSSAVQASGFAADAYQSEQDAYASAIAVGKNAVEAAAIADQAVNFAKTQVPVLNKQQQAAEQQLCHSKGLQGDELNDCLHMTTATADEWVRNAWYNVQNCKLVPGQQQPDCIADATSPTFKLDQNLELTNTVIDALAKYALGVAEAGVGSLPTFACMASVVCAGALAAIAPEGALFPELLGAAQAGSGLDLLLARALGLAENTSLGAEAEAQALADSGSDFLQACATNSFTGDTPVLLPGGAAEPIKDVAVGDSVVSTDPSTGRTGTNRVGKLITGHGVKHFVDLTISTAGGSSTLEATYNHPFWVDNRNSWVDAQDLTIGDHLHAADGAPAVVGTIGRRDAVATVYNLTVDDVHTFYVLAGKTPVLVHNSGCWVEKGGPGTWGSVEEERMSAASAAYQMRVTGGVPVGIGYRVGGVKFDGYQDGVLIDAKAKYDQFVKNGEFVDWFSGAESMASQAKAQVRVAGGVPIEWRIMQPEVLAAIRDLFQKNNITGINLVLVP
jgi:hypothetical protein